MERRHNHGSVGSQQGEEHVLPVWVVVVFIEAAGEGTDRWIRHSPIPNKVHVEAVVRSTENPIRSRMHRLIQATVARSGESPGKPFETIQHAIAVIGTRIPKFI